jgi:hypothetical protein
MSPKETIVGTSAKSHLFREGVPAQASALGAPDGPALVKSGPSGSEHAGASGLLAPTPSSCTLRLKLPRQSSHRSSALLPPSSRPDILHQKACPLVVRGIEPEHPLEDGLGVLKPLEAPEAHAVAAQTA